MANQLGSQRMQYFEPIIQALKALGDSGSPGEVIDYISSHYDISDFELELLDSGSTRFSKNVNWARYYLVKAGYIDGSKRGVWLLTEKGRTTTRFTNNKAMEIIHDVQEQSPTKAMLPTKELDEISIDEQEVRENLDHRKQLLIILKEKVSPEGFERFCRRLLREAGFEQLEVTQQSHDGGIDGKGILKINPLVSFRVYFQCKRYSGVVGVRDIRDFRGAIVGKADKGIILTTGKFTQDAQAEAIRDGVVPIELVDSEKLLNMLEDLELGIEKKRTIVIYDIKEGFFDEYY